MASPLPPPGGRPRGLPAGGIRGGQKRPIHGQTQLCVRARARRPLRRLCSFQRLTRRGAAAKQRQRQAAKGQQAKVPGLKRSRCVAADCCIVVALEQQCGCGVQLAAQCWRQHVLHELTQRQRCWGLCQHTQAQLQP